MSTYREEPLAARFAALAPEPLPADWLDVQRRLRRKGRRRTLTLLIAAALAVIVVGSALALGPHVVDFFSSAAPSHRTLLAFERARPALDASWGTTVPVDVAAARIVLETDDRRITAAPLTTGVGFCVLLSQLDGGRESPGNAQCVVRDGPVVEPNADGGGYDAEWRPTGARDFLGWVTAPGTDHLVVRYEDGTHDDVGLVWVSKPIEAGFFAFDPGPAHLRAGRRATTIEAVDARGGVLADTFFTYGPQLSADDPLVLWSVRPGQVWPRAIDPATARALAIPGLPTWVGTVIRADARDGGLCIARSSPTRPRAPRMLLACHRPGYSVTDDGVFLLRMSGHPGPLLVAIVPRRASIEARFEDGRTLTLGSTQRAVVYVIPRGRSVVGRRMVALTVRSSGGGTLARYRLIWQQPTAGSLPVVGIRAVGG